MARNLAMARPLLQLIEVFFFSLARFVGVHARGGINPVVAFGNAQRGVHHGPAPPLRRWSADSARPAARARAMTCFAVGVEIGVVKMTVRIDEELKH